MAWFSTLPAAIIIQISLFTSSSIAPPASDVVSSTYNLLSSSLINIVVGSSER
mgnify:CR=1 FL=1